MVRHDGGIVHHFHDFHHPAVLVAQDVAMQDEFPKKIIKARTHFDMARNNDGFPVSRGCVKDDLCFSGGLQNHLPVVA